MASERFQRQIDRLLDEAETALSRFDWQSVRQCAQAVLAIDPRNDDGLTFLAAAERALDTSSPDLTSSLQQAEPATTEPLSPLEAERRQLTVMFCDLQSSTALSEQLDPEELRDVIRSYQEVCAGAIDRFEGHIAKYLGDGLLVYFGYPQAHEDDPRRAVHAGLAVIADMTALNHRLREKNGLELAVRIGVHTGLVVAGEMGGGDSLESMAIVGETPNIAARLQEAAEPNSLVISNITANLIQGFFICEALGAHELKGISKPMELLRVLEESGAQTRYDVAAASLTPLVGREQELGLLLDRWDQAQEGLGQVVLLSGEPGIGKSRLIEAVTERLTKESYTLHRFRCSAYHQNSALHPVLEHVEGWLGFAREDSPEEKLGKLEIAVTKIDFPLVEAVSLLSGLLSFPLPEQFTPLAMSPEVQRESTRELLVALLLDATEDQPVFFVVEDLHWADPSTLAMLGLLLDQVPTTKVLALLSFRPEFTPPWPSRAYMTPVTLNRLTRRLAGEMVDQLTGDKSLPEEVFSQIASKSDGVPLFVEELTRMVLESDFLKEVEHLYELNGPLPLLAIPSTLQDSLTARLDRLVEERDVIQLAAVLGREFSYELIQAVSPIDEETLRTHLRRLVDAEFLYQRGLPQEATYVFKHALMQDAAYNSLLISRRQHLHQLTAQVLEESSTNVAEMQPELLAHHFAQAGLPERAVDYWLRAGERALETHAHEEALAHFDRGLVARNIPLSGTEEAPDEEAAALLFGRARAQSATAAAGRLGEAFTTLSRAFEYYVDAGNVAQAVAVAEFPITAAPTRFPGGVELMARALTLVPSDSHEAGRLLSRYGGILGLAEGDYEGSQQALDLAMAIARREGDVPLEVQTLAYAADVSGQHLHWQESVDHGLRAIELAGDYENLFSEVISRYWTAVSFLHMGDLDAARPHALLLRDFAERQSTPRHLARISFAPITILSSLEGDWSAGREHSGRGLEVGPLHPQILGPRIMLEHETGESARGEAYLEQFLGTIRSSSDPLGTARVSLVIATIARITGVLDRLESAEAVLAVISEQSVRPINVLNAKAGLALLAVQKADRSAALEHYAYLLGQRGTMIWDLTSVDRLLGLLSQTMGDLAQAALHFEDSMAFCRKAGYRPELAWTCCDYADMLRERNAEGDRSRAIALLDESLAISSELGMRPLMERVLSRREILKA